MVQVTCYPLEPTMTNDDHYELPEDPIRQAEQQLEALKLQSPERKTLDEWEGRLPPPQLTYAQYKHDKLRQTAADSGWGCGCELCNFVRVLTHVMRSAG
jgi:hypothetical protein